MKNCANCKHWDNSEDYSYKGLGRCKATPMRYDASEWVDDYDHRVMKPEYAQTTAFVQDMSDCSATLYTRPEHFCSMHEPDGILRGDDCDDPDAAIDAARAGK